MPCCSSASVAAAAPGWPAEAREHATQLVANHLWKTALTLDDYLDVGSLHHRLQTAGQPVCGLILKHTKENDCQSPVLPRKLEYTASNSGNAANNNSTAQLHHSYGKQSSHSSLIHTSSANSLQTQQTLTCPNAHAAASTCVRPGTHSDRIRQSCHDLLKPVRQPDQALELREILTSIQPHAKALDWDQVLALGCMPAAWQPPKPLNTAKIVESQRHRLLMLYHALHCTEEEDCYYGKLCTATKHLWQHIAFCSDAACDPRCAGTKQLMNHHQVCRIPECPVCIPVNEIIAEEHLLLTMLEEQQQQQLEIFK